MAINSQDEPAWQVALETALAKQIGTIFAAAGLYPAAGVDVSLAIGVVGTLAALISLVQGRVTRSKVFSSASVEQVKAKSAADATAAILSPNPDSYPEA